MVDIIVGSIPPAQNQSRQQDRRQRAPLRKKKLLKDKRENEEDRRRSVRDGVVVSLSSQMERREGPDRRKP